MFASAFGALCGALAACIVTGIDIIKSLLNKQYDLMVRYIGLYLLAEGLVIITFLWCLKVLFS